MNASGSATSGSWAVLAARYTGLLLRRQRADAAALIRQLVDDGADIRDIYLEILQASQIEIGRLWETKEISVAEEHYCTAVTQQVIAGFYPVIFRSASDGRRMVMACASTELHELGGRMVADFLQLAGWDTYYLSANVPTDSILAEVEASGAHLLGLSVALPETVPLVTDIVDAVRRDLSRPVPVLVGGRPFNLDPDLWRRVGADGYAADARDAVVQADRLVPSPGRR